MFNAGRSATPGSLEIIERNVDRDHLKRQIPLRKIRARRRTDTDWRSFVSQIAEGDGVWEFDTVEAYRGFASGVKGLALVRRGAVVAKLVQATFD